MNKETERISVLLETCRNILRTEGIPAAEKITGIKINRRARSRFGRCTKTRSGYEIEVSEQLLKCDEKEIETVLLHELLHTCPKCMNHGQLWKRYAEILNRKYGYNITVRTSYEKLGLENPGSRESIKYRIVCTKCGQEYPRRRKCSLTENPERYSCGKCGGKLEIR